MATLDTVYYCSGNIGDSGVVVMVVVVLTVLESQLEVKQSATH